MEFRDCQFQFSPPHTSVNTRHIKRIFRFRNQHSYLSLLIPGGTYYYFSRKETISIPTLYYSAHTDSTHTHTQGSERRKWIHVCKRGKKLASQQRNLNNGEALLPSSTETAIGKRDEDIDFNSSPPPSKKELILYRYSKGNRWIRV